MSLGITETDTALVMLAQLQATETHSKVYDHGVQELNEDVRRDRGSPRTGCCFSLVGFMVSCSPSPCA